VLVEPIHHRIVAIAEAARRCSNDDPQREPLFGFGGDLATGEKQPYAIALKAGGIMALAGLWENWKSPADEWVRSFTIVTTTPNALCAEIHDRMPVILPPAAWPAWLGETTADSERLKELLAPYPADQMTCWPVSARMGNVKNNDPSLIEPIAAR
jgi:putative SOS response-associated peptidase YedK